MWKFGLFFFVLNQAVFPISQNTFPLYAQKMGYCGKTEFVGNTGNTSTVRLLLATGGDENDGDVLLQVKLLPQHRVEIKVTSASTNIDVYLQKQKHGIKTSDIAVNTVTNVDTIMDKSDAFACLITKLLNEKRDAYNGLYDGKTCVVDGIDSIGNYQNYSVIPEAIPYRIAMCLYAYKLKKIPAAQSWIIKSLNGTVSKNELIDSLTIFTKCDRMKTIKKPWWNIW